MKKSRENSSSIKYDTFAQRCMSLPFGYDETLCEGQTCPHRRKCVRYMLHVKKRLTATPGAAFYMMCAPKYNFELCFWSYEETKRQWELKSNSHNEQVSSGTEV